VKEDLTIRDMTDLMETMNGDRITARRMTEMVIGPMEIAPVVPVMTIVMEDMVTAMEEGTTTVKEDTTITTVRLLMETTVRLMGILIITVLTEIMIVNTIVPARKDIATDP
jgi:hypothetical protein